MDMNRIFIHGVYFIKHLQRRFWKQESFFICASYLGDPKFAYLLHFPVIFAVSRRIGFQWLIAACISECVNLVLKWIFQEDRPYWWVGENSHKVENMTLKQFPITCESGPGNPSGHVMVTTTLLYVLVHALIQGKSVVTKIVAWSICLTLISVVAASRMFLAAHFPHQCLLGFTIGVALGSTISKAELSDLSSRNLFRAGILCCIATMATYYIQITLGHDPNESLNLALKWCVKRSYVHLDNTPLFASMRYIGVLLGTGLAVRGLSWDRYISGNSFHVIVGSIVLGIAACMGVLYCPMPPSTTAVYFFNCVLHAALFIILVRMIPEGLMWMFSSHCKKD